MVNLNFRAVQKWKYRWLFVWQRQRLTYFPNQTAKTTMEGRMLGYTAAHLRISDLLHPQPVLHFPTSLRDLHHHNLKTMASPITTTTTTTTLLCNDLAGASSPDTRQCTSQTRAETIVPVAAATQCTMGSAAGAPGSGFRRSESPAPRIEYGSGRSPLPRWQLSPMMWRPWPSVAVTPSSTSPAGLPLYRFQHQHRPVTSRRLQRARLLPSVLPGTLCCHSHRGGLRGKREILR